MCADHRDHKKESVELSIKTFDFPEILNDMEEGCFDDVSEIAKKKLYEDVETHDLQRSIISHSEAIRIQDLDARMYTHIQA